MDKHARIAKIVQELLDGLGEMVPPAALAARAVASVENLRESKEAQAKLEQAVSDAEKDFTRQAEQDPEVRPLAEGVRQLPLHNLPRFREALKHLLEHWDETALEETLAQNLAEDFGGGAPGHGLEPEQPGRFVG